MNAGKEGADSSEERELGAGLRLRELSTAHEVVRSSRLTTSGRSSLLVEKRLRDGSLLRGEASPLSGYGDDSLERARLDLNSLKGVELWGLLETLAEDEGRGAPEREGLRIRAEDPLVRIEQLLSSFSSPSARFCVETFCLNALAVSCRKPVSSFLSFSDRGTEFLTSAVLDPLREGALEQSRRFLKAGLGTFKIKCGTDLEREAEFLRRLGRELKAGNRLRLDANRRWSLSEAREMQHRTEGLPIEWVEDPLRLEPEGEPFRLWRRLQEECPSLVLALDEPLVGRAPSMEFLESTGASVLILKPMALGGMLCALRWAEFARQLGQSVCVSHLFDGPVALAAYAELGFAIQTDGRAAGLGLHAGLQGFAAQGIHPESRLAPALFSQ